MDPTVLVGLLAVLGITSVYFWVVRRKSQEQAPSVPAGPDQK